MKKQNFMFSLMLIGSMLSSVAVYAMDPNAQTQTNGRLNFPAFFKQYPPTIRNVTFLAIAGSCFRLFWRDPKPDAKPRYDISKATDLSLMLSNPGEYTENLYYLWDDGFVGQHFKDKYMKVNLKDGTIKQSRACQPFGVLGNVFSVLAVTKKTQDMMEKLVTLAGAIQGAYLVHYLANPHLSHLSHGKDKATDPVAIQALQENTASNNRVAVAFEKLAAQQQSIYPVLPSAPADTGAGTGTKTEETPH